MKLLSIHKLNKKGFSHHFLLPVIVIVAVAGIGTYVLKVSHAATASVYKGHCAQNIQLLQSAAGSANATCTQQVQDLIDIYQYSATNHFGIPGNGETFSYGGAAMIIMNGHYNGATQSAVNTFSHSVSLTNASSASNLGSWNTFCSTVAGKLGAAGFAHSYYDFSPGHNRAAGYYIGSSGKSIFSSVCGSPTSVSFSSGSNSGSSSGSSSSSSSTACDRYSISSSSHGGAPAQCIYYVQSIVNAAYQANTGNYAGVANRYDSFYRVSNGLIAGVTKTDNNYNNITKIRVMAFQATFYGSDGSNLGIDGVTGPATWGALCAVARSYKTNPHNYSWISAAQSAAKSGCSGTSGSVHQRSTAVAPGTSSSGGSGTGGVAGGGNGMPTITSFNFSLASEDPNFVQNHNLYPDVYIASWTSQNSGNCYIVNGSNMMISNASYGANGKTDVALKAAFPYTVTLTCGNANGSTSAHKYLTAPTP